MYPYTLYTTSMTLNEIPEVTLDEAGGYKYILVEAADEAQQIKYILFGDKTMPYHSHLFNSFKIKYGDSFTYTCNGGGYIQVSSKDSTITLHGESTAYGEVDLDIVQSILRTNYPEYQILITS